MSDRRAPREAKRRVHPRDAASVVLLRGSRSDPEVLLGRRRLDARFMPGIYVFPGGRVDREDYRHASEARLRADVMVRMRRHCIPRRARALVWAALRETWEETGLLIGRKGRIEHLHPSDLHRAYAHEGLKPLTESLDYIARAITPAHNPIRYNTRFFLADGANAYGVLHHSSELEDIGWRRVSEALDDLNLMHVTLFALTEAMKVWDNGLRPDPERPVIRLTTRVRARLMTRE